MAHVDAAPGAKFASSLDAPLRLPTRAEPAGGNAPLRPVAHPSRVLPAPPPTVLMGPFATMSEAAQGYSKLQSEVEALRAQLLRLGVQPCV